MDSFQGLKLLEFCGSGAYGDVYYCEDISGKKMAVKIVSKKKIGEHWKREFRGIVNYRKITDENNSLLKIFHVSEDDECFYYTMEAADSFDSQKYIPDTLALRLQKGPIAAEELTPILSSIFEGIKAIHRAGFSHRDIKPDNILFVNGKPKLADIGLLASENVSVTTIAGTFDFIPPEIRYSATIDSYDNAARQKCDLYAFGKVIYCTITGLEVQFFPSLPHNRIFNLAEKLFMRLALELCSPTPSRRSYNLITLEKKLITIQRKILYGETWIDKVLYVMWRSLKSDKSLTIELLEASSMTWSIVLSALLLIFSFKYLEENGFPWFDLIRPEYFLPLGLIFLLSSYVVVNVAKDIIRFFFNKSAR